LRELREEPQEDDDPECNDDRPDVLRGDRDTADVDDAGPEWTLELLGLAGPLPDDEPVDRDQEPDRDDDDPQDVSALDWANDDAVRRHPAAERDRQGRHEGRPVAPAVVDRERPGD